MRNLPLNQSRVDRLKPRNSTYDIRDTDLKGFGIRTLPSGKKSYFLQTQHEGQRRWTKIGDADAMPETEARSQARSLLAGIRKGRESIPDLPPDIASWPAPQASSPPRPYPDQSMVPVPVAASGTPKSRRWKNPRQRCKLCKTGRR